MTVKMMFAIVSKLMSVKAHLVVLSRGADAREVLQAKLDELGLGKKVGISFSTVVELANPVVRGMFFPELDIILIKDQKSFMNNLSVIVHECRHAWQKQDGWEFPNMPVAAAYNHKVEIDARRFTDLVMGVVGYTSSVLIGYAIGMALREIMGLNKKKEA